MHTANVVYVVQLDMMRMNYPKKYKVIDLPKTSFCSRKIISLNFVADNKCNCFNSLILLTIMNKPY